MQTLRVGFLGTGWVAQSHAKALLKQPNVTIAALCKRHFGKAKSFNDEIAGGAARCYDDFARMLDNEQLDALYVCLPPGSHVGQIEHAASHGLHLMLEKPIALTLERAASIHSAVKRAKVVCQIGHHMRHTLPARKLKQMLLDGSAGRPLMMQGRFFTNALYPAWWKDPNQGGGQLIEQSIHLYNLARYFLGDASVVQLSRETSRTSAGRTTASTTRAPPRCNSRTTPSPVSARRTAPTRSEARSRSPCYSKK